jgi:hypothetical protein
MEASSLLSTTLWMGGDGPRQNNEYVMENPTVKLTLTEMAKFVPDSGTEQLKISSRDLITTFIRREIILG